MSKPRTGVYPGTFDPVTNGHLDIINRARRLVDHLIIAVALNDGKQPMFDIDQRLAISTGVVLHRLDEQGVLVTKSVVEALSANPHLGGQVGETRRFVSVTPEYTHRLFESLLPVKFSGSSDRHNAIIGHMDRSVNNNSGELLRIFRSATRCELACSRCFFFTAYGGNSENFAFCFGKILPRPMHPPSTTNWPK